jgi:hypothetical protein
MHSDSITNHYKMCLHIQLALTYTNHLFMATIKYNIYTQHKRNMLIIYHEVSALIYKCFAYSFMIGK